MAAVEVLRQLQVPLGGVCDSQRGATPLMVAARRGSLQLATVLLQESKVNAQDRRGYTALMHACAAGHEAIVQLLLSFHADTTIQSSGGLTALHLAAAAGHEHIALPLLQHWTRIDSLTTRTTSVLHCAAIGGCTQVATQFLQSHPTASVTDADPQALTPVFLSHAFGHAAVLHTLVQHWRTHKEASPQEGDTGDSQSLRCLQGDSRLWRYSWLSATLTLNQQFAPSSSSANSNKPSANLTLRPGEQLYTATTRRFRKSRSQLLWCVRTGNVVGVRVLSDFDVVDDCFALHLAAEQGLVDMVQLLLALHMSDPTLEDRKGRTALERAIAAGKEKTAMLLVQNMKPSIDCFAKRNSNGLNLFHVICAAKQCPHLIAGIVSETTGDPQKASAVLEAMKAPDAAGITPFEYSLLFGNAGTALRFAYAIHQLGVQTRNQVSIPVSSALLCAMSVLSPAVRTLLFDILGVSEVATAVGFEARRDKTFRATFHRLSFPDVRVIGIQQLRDDTFLSTRADELFTVDHERAVFKSVVQQLDLHFRLKFCVETIRHLPEPEQVALLQRLTTSPLLGRYVDLTSQGVPLASVELGLANNRANVCCSLSDNGTIVDHFALGKGTLITSPLPEELLQRATLPTQQQSAANDTLAAALKSAADNLNLLPHPLLHTLRVIVDWGTGENAPTPPQRLKATELLLSFCGVLALDKSQPFYRSLEEELYSITDENINAVASVPSVARSVSFIFTKGFQGESTKEELGAPQSKNLRAAAHRDNNHLDIQVPFSTTCVGRVEDALLPLQIVVRRDSALLRIHRIRDAFLEQIRGIFAEELHFKLELESTEVQTLPLALLEQCLSDLAAELRDVTLVRGRHQKDRNKARSEEWEAGGHQLEATTNGETCLALKSSAIIRLSVKSVRAVTVVFTTKRDAQMKRTGPKLLLYFTSELAPSRDDIRTSLRRDSALMESAALKDYLSPLVVDMCQRLNAYIPNATLVVDLPSITAVKDPEDLLSALAVLCAERSKYVLQTIAKGLSIGWDGRLGTILRRHVRHVDVVLTTQPTSSLALLADTGHILYSASLLCAQYHNSLRGLLSSETIASLALIQLSPIEKEIPKLLETKAAMPYWCRVYGGHTRAVVAGQKSCHFVIAAYNVLNRRCQAGGEMFDVQGASNLRLRDLGDGSYRVHFSAPEKAGRMRIQVALRGQPLPRSPLNIAVWPGPCRVSRTSLECPFDMGVANTVVTCFVAARDEYGNELKTSPGSDFTISIPRSTGAHDGMYEAVSVSDLHNGRFELRLRLNQAGHSAIAVRVAYKNQAQVLMKEIDVISPEQFEKILKLRCRKTIRMASSPSDMVFKRNQERVKLFFRKTVRDSERQRHQREVAEVFGEQQKGKQQKRQFPHGTFRGFHWTGEEFVRREGGNTKKNASPPAAQGSPAIPSPQRRRSRRQAKTKKGTATAAAVKK